MEDISRTTWHSIRKSCHSDLSYLPTGIFSHYQEEDTDYYDSRRSAARRRFEEDLEMEAQAEKRIINAKKVQKSSGIREISPYFLILFQLT